MRNRHSMGWIVLLFFALASAACGAGTGRSTAPGTSPAGQSVGSISAKIPLGPSSDKYSITVSATAVWVQNFAAGTLQRIDPSTNQVVATIAIGQGPGHVALEGGFVWALSHDDSVVWKIDPQTNLVVTKIMLPPPNAFLAVSPGAIWVASRGNQVVRKIDTQTDQVVATLSLPNQPAWMSYGAGSLWVCGFNGGVWRLDPISTRVLKQFDIGVQQGHACAALAALDDTIWVEVFEGNDFSGSHSGVLMYRIDTATDTLDATASTMPLDLMEGVVADAQGAWVLGVDSGLYHVDPHTNQTGKALQMKGGGGLALGDGSVWVATDDGTLLRITPTT